MEQNLVMIQRFFVQLDQLNVILTIRAESGWQDVIFGFVTQNCMATGLNIPDPLIMIILAFFYLMESFKSVNGDGLQITNNGLTIKRIGKNGFNAYGAIGIDSQTKTLTTWKIKIDERKSALVIGLIAIPKDSNVKWESKLS